MSFSISQFLGFTDADLVALLQTIEQSDSLDSTFKSIVLNREMEGLVQVQ